MPNTLTAGETELLRALVPGPLSRDVLVLALVKPRREVDTLLRQLHAAGCIYEIHQYHPYQFAITPHGETLL